MTYKLAFAILEIEMLKTSVSAVKRIGQMFVFTLNRKVGSGCPRASIINHNHGLKVTVFKGIRKKLLSTAKRCSFPSLTKLRKVKEMVFLSKVCGKFVSVVNKI